MGASEPWERSFGGDYWLHLSLLELQTDSWRTYNLPALLISFEPLGGLSPVALSSGGAIYIGLGILGSFGVPIPILAPLGVLGVSLVVFLSIYSVARKHALSSWLAAIAGCTPLCFAWVLGDGFGRGAISSTIAGLLSIAAIITLLGLIVLTPGQRREPHLRLIPVLLVGSACSVHIPSTVILIVFGIPLVLLSALIIRGFDWFILSSILSSSALGLLLGSLFWMPSLALGMSDDFGLRQTSLQLETSEAFGDPSILWGFLRSVPDAHIEAWQGWVGDRFTNPTSLYVTQPVLLITLLLSFFILQRQKFGWRITIGLLLPLVILYFMVMVPGVWSLFPDALNTLEYSFRLLYLPIAWFVVILVLTLASFQGPGEPLRVGVIGLVVTLVIVELARSSVQLDETTNLSLVRPEPGETGTELVRGKPVVWRYNRSPDEAALSGRSAPYWYSALDWRARDATKYDLSASRCPRIDLVDLWPAWPGQSDLVISNPKSTCVRLPLAPPLSWLQFKGGQPVGRDPETLDAVVSISANELFVSTSDRKNPIKVGGFLSILGLAFVAATAGSRFVRRRN